MDNAVLPKVSAARTGTGHGSPSAPLARRHARGRLSVVLAWAAVLFVVGFASLPLAGYRYISTRGVSMEPAFSSGSLLLARLTRPEDIQAGDVIAFPGFAEGIPSIVHRVVVLVKEGGSRYGITMGDNNPVPDPELLPLDRPMARVLLVLPYLGWWVTPTLGWYFLAISALLYLRLYLRWSTQRATVASTKALPKAGLIADDPGREPRQPVYVGSRACLGGEPL